MQIMPNPLMVGLQMIPFLLTVIALYQIIFKPMLAYLDARDAAIAGGHDAARDLDTKLAEKQADYDGRIAAARAEVQALCNARRAASKAAYQARIGVARGEADAKVTVASAEIAKLGAVAATDLEQTARSLAGSIAERVLGRTMAVG